VEYVGWEARVHNDADDVVGVVDVKLKFLHFLDGARTRLQLDVENGLERLRGRVRDKEIQGLQ